MNQRQTLIRHHIQIDANAIASSHQVLLDAINVIGDVSGSLRMFRESWGLTRSGLAVELLRCDDCSTLTESVIAAIEAGNRSPGLGETIALLEWMMSLPVTPAGTMVPSNHSDPESETPDD